jgi:hypothetical protein
VKILKQDRAADARIDNAKDGNDKLRLEDRPQNVHHDGELLIFRTFLISGFTMPFIAPSSVDGALLSRAGSALAPQFWSSAL